MQKIDWKDGAKKVLTKGQKKRLMKETNNMENEDHALWSTLRGQKLTFSRGWKTLLEFFAGCALTAVFQASGHAYCSPLDINNGWNFFYASHRRHAEDIVDRENPYLVTIAFPCGPWSLWQRLNLTNDESTWEKVSESRRAMASDFPMDPQDRQETAGEGWQDYAGEPVAIRGLDNFRDAASIQPGYGDRQG